MSFCLSVTLSVYVRLCICLSLSLSVSLYLFITLLQSVSCILSVSCLFLSYCSSIPFVCLSVRSSVHLCLVVCLSLPFCLAVCLSLFLSLFSPHLFYLLHLLFFYPIFLSSIFHSRLSTSGSLMFSALSCDDKDHLSCYVTSSTVHYTWVTSFMTLCTRPRPCRAKQNPYHPDKYWYLCFQVFSQ